jgi:hypothetical protein
VVKEGRRAREVDEERVEETEDGGKGPRSKKGREGEKEKEGEKEEGDLANGDCGAGGEGGSE